MRKTLDAEPQIDKKNNDVRGIKYVPNLNGEQRQLNHESRMTIPTLAMYTRGIQGVVSAPAFDLRRWEFALTTPPMLFRSSVFFKSKRCGEYDEHDLERCHPRQILAFQQ